MERRTLTAIVKLSLNGHYLFNDDLLFLREHGMTQSADVKFFECDADNFINNKITVRINISLLGTNIPISKTLYKIIKKIGIRSALFAKVPKEMLEDFDGMKSFIKSMFK